VNTALIAHKEDLKIINTSVLDRILDKIYSADKDHRVFDTQEEAIAFAARLGVPLKKRGEPVAPKTLQKDGKNPTVRDIMSRFWGISTENLARMVPTDESKWCVYWKPSLLPPRKPRKGLVRLVPK
jgi:hypothetical protein